MQYSGLFGRYRANLPAPSLPNGVWGNLFVRSPGTGLDVSVILFPAVAIERKCLTERLRPQPNGNCRHRRHVRPLVSQVPSYDAGDPDVAVDSRGPGAPKPKFRSQFPKKSSRYDEKTKISSVNTSEAGFGVIQRLKTCDWG